MLIARNNEAKVQPISEQAINNGMRKIKGYRFKFADWEGRYMRELQSGKILNIDSTRSINKQSIQSVENSIYDKELGDLNDTDKDIREFSCDCGNLYGRFYEGTICKECGTPVVSKYNMDISRVGWIDIHPFFIINPNAFELMSKAMGLKNLQKILQYDIQIDLNGNLSSESQTPESYRTRANAKAPIPYANTGMIEFRKNFNQIVSYYSALKHNEDIGQFLIEHQNEIFSSKIPVSSVYLRPTFVSSKKRSVSFDKLNATYIKILSNATLLKRVMKKEVEYKRSLNVVCEIQNALQELYTDTIKTKLSGKTKLIRGSILGNRVNFSSRMVIRSFVGPELGMGKIEMSYKGFLELNLLEVINALLRGYGDPMFSRMTVYEVIEYVQRAQYSDEIDPVIWDILNKILKSRDHNPVLVLRPPSLALGSLQYFDVCRITPDAKDKTASIGLDSLQEFNGDFDGDCLSFYAIKEKCVADAFREGLSPKSLQMDRGGDNYYNNKFCLIKDEITNLMSFLS